MAKLNVVVPAVDVEIDGVKYRKVERDVREGDVIKITDNVGVDTVSEGGFYTVTELDWADDPQIIDEDGDSLDCCGMKYEVYEKVAETVASPYREVIRWAEAGDRIRIVNVHRSERYYGNGAEFVVNSVDGDGDVRVTVGASDCHIVALSEYVVLEPVQPAQPKRLTVGDYAKITRELDGHDFIIGEIVKIVEDDESKLPYKGEAHDERYIGAAWFTQDECEPATEAEFLAQNKLKVGEFAKVTCTIGNPFSLGDVVEVYETDVSGIPYNARKSDGTRSWMRASQIVKATPAEVAAAQREAKEALRYGDFTDGDYAQVVNATGNNASVTVVNSGGKFGKVSREIGGFRSLMIRFADGGYGYCNPDALRKVTREEYEAATKPALLPIGSYGRITRAGVTRGAFESHRFEVGEIVKVIGHAVEHNDRVKAEYLDGSDYWSVHYEDIEQVDVEEAKWATIGRKVNEFKRGDIVQGTGHYTDKLEYGEVLDVSDEYLGVEVSDRGYAAMKTAEVLLIAPAEQRFDKTELDDTAQAA